MPIYYTNAREWLHANDEYYRIRQDGKEVDYYSIQQDGMEVRMEVYQTPEVWGRKVGDAAFHPKYGLFPSKFVRPAPSVQETREILTRNAWTLDWRHTWRHTPWEKSDKSGQHIVRFAQRDGDIIAVIESDAVLGFSAAEAKVTVTRAGISYFVPKLGRLRMRVVIEDGQASFTGGVLVPFASVFVQAEPPNYAFPSSLRDCHARAVLRPVPRASAREMDTPSYCFQ